MKSTKKAYLSSLLAIVLCIALLIGTTFAWFTDSVTSGGNIIKSGNLDIEMYWTDDLQSGTWYNVEDPAHNTIFSYDNWEPGYTDVKYIKIKNNGNLALNYELSIDPQNGVGKLAEVINVYFANECVELNGRDDLSKLRAIGLLSNVLNGGATANGTLLAAGQQGSHKSGEVIVTLAMNMITSAGNEYQDTDAGDFTVTALATQASFEEDSFGSDYDNNAEFPVMLKPGEVSAPVTTVDNKVSTEVVLSGDGISATVPAGTLLKEGTKNLKFSVTPLKNTTSEITVVNNEVLIPVDVHIEGIDPNNTTPIIIDLGAVLPKYLNMGNYRLYHVEKGVSKVMTYVSNRADLTAHNTFTYNLNTGEVSVAMSSFSEVALIADTSKPWQGSEDYTWYDKNKNELTIANADQLHAFSKIVGGMANDIDQDSFSGKIVKLLSNINLNNGTVLPDIEGTTKTIFYPIGYSNNQAFSSGNNVNRPENITGEVKSDVQVFEGTFDGNGHKISHFYQNTWEMFGDYNNGYSGTPNYYKDAMGLFAWVDGTVKNLTVDNFESDGEFTPTGVIAAYAGFYGNAKFENIAITNCNPRVYNTGNGGIVGIGGNESRENKIVFENITIDNTNKITALWGSWDVACGGLMGMFRGKDSDNAVVTMKNCHVAAQMDVYNDVCGNYQYYWYRYSGMLVGTNYNMTTDDKGYTVPNTAQYTAENCTVHFGDWNDYYYCELVANSLASYTHDHQFSRLTEIKSIDEIRSGDTWTKAGNFMLTDGQTKTCYHIVNKNGTLVPHYHEASGYETNIDEDNDGNVDLKEDKQIVYLRFNQLFTGYGWGVKHVPIYDNDKDNAFKGVKILKDHATDSVKKFAAKDDVINTYKTGMTVSIGKLFKELDGVSVPVKSDKVQVFVSPVGEGSTVTATFTPSTTENWQDATITFGEGVGLANITINDYYFCTPTTFTVNVTALSEEDKYLNDYNNWNMFSTSVKYTDPSTGEVKTTTEYEVPSYDSDGDGYSTEISENAHGNNDYNGSIKFDTSYGRTDDSSILLGNNGRYAYIKLPELSENTNYILTFYYSGLEKMSNNTILGNYYLFAPNVENASLAWAQNGSLYSAGFNYAYSSEDGIFNNRKNLNDATYYTANDSLVAEDGKWNKVKIAFNSSDFEDLYLLIKNAGIVGASKQQCERWIDDISLVEANQNNSADMWNGSGDSLFINDNSTGNALTSNAKISCDDNAPVNYPGSEKYIHISNFAHTRVTTKLTNLKHNTNYTLKFSYLAPLAPAYDASENVKKYYHISAIGIITVGGKYSTSAANNVGTISCILHYSGFEDGKASSKRTEIKVGQAGWENSWIEQEINFNSGENTELMLVLVGGGKSINAPEGSTEAYKDIYITNFEVVEK